MALMTDAPPWVERFAGLARLAQPTKDALLEQSVILNAPAGTVLFGPGTSPEHMLFLLEGRARVSQVSENGHEIVLYRIQSGESCVLTTACLLAYEDYSAEGLAETDVVAAAVPKTLFDELVAGSKPFRDFVFAAFSKRITGLFQMIDEVAFQRIDVRLAGRLVELAGEDAEIQTTHQKLSVELGTAREVVSRQLQEFQRRGWVQPARGLITILDRPALMRLAENRD